MGSPEPIPSADLAPKPTLNPNLRSFWETRSRNKVLYGGRASSKSWDAAGHAIRLADNYKLKFLCVRQLQNKIEESVYSLLKIQIDRFGLRHRFKILENKIINTHTGTEFVFYGLWRHVEEIKSIESVDILWSEESHGLTESQWEILEPTIRKEGSEVWLLFNPGLVSDFVWRNFVVSPPPNTIVREINYPENPFLSQTMLDVIEAHRLRNPETFEHVYLGKPRSDDDSSVIKASWVLSSIDAHLLIPGLEDGRSTLGFDVADDGDDKCATIRRDGSVARSADEWEGREDEILKSCTRAYHEAQKSGAHIVYDCIGVGASAGAKFNELNKAHPNNKVTHDGFNAGGKVLRPEAIYGDTKIKNKDFFSNIKAQMWWQVADRFMLTHQVVQAIKNGTPPPKFKIEDLISIDSTIEHLEKLKMELSIPLRDFDNNGRVKVESKKDLKKREVPSPNLADAFIMAYSPIRRGLNINPDNLRR